MKKHKVAIFEQNSASKLTETINDFFAKATRIEVISLSYSTLFYHDGMGPRYSVVILYKYD